MNDASQAPYPQYRCVQCGKELPLTDAHLAVMCGDHRSADADIEVTIRAAVPADRHDIEDICDQALGETEVDAFGRSFDVMEQENVIAVFDGRLAGLVSLAVHEGDLTVVLLSVYPEFQGHGVGRALIGAAVDLAGARGLPAVKAAISNDDVPLFSFYQRHDFVIDSVARGLLADRYGSAEPGFSGILVRDEIRLRRSVCRG